MVRKPGSGLARPTTTAIEGLVAAVFVGDTSVPTLSRLLDAQVSRGRSGVSGADAVRWIDALAQAAGLDVQDAVTPSPDLLGDVRLTLRDGSSVWIEVKAQTTKGFNELLQADWVRDETDALRYLATHDDDLEPLLSPWMSECLEIDDPGRQFGSLDFPDLWLADLALLPDRPRRAIAGVNSSDDLLAFLGRKFLLHLTSEGARLVRLDQLPCVARVADGEPLYVDVAPGGACDARVWVSSAGAPRRGAIDFIYYAGYATGVVGRHKLHPTALIGADGMMVAR